MLRFGRLSANFKPVPCASPDLTSVADGNRNELYKLLCKPDATVSLLGFIPASSVHSTVWTAACLLQPQSGPDSIGIVENRTVVTSPLLTMLLCSTAEAGTVGVCVIAGKFALLVPLPTTPGHKPDALCLALVNESVDDLTHKYLRSLSFEPVVTSK